LSRNPAAIQNVARQLSVDHKRAYDQLRVIGLNLTAPVKLARLLLEWGAETGGTRTEQGARIHCSLSHTEIGEYIGVARETISRILSDFKKRKLVERRGSTLVILSIRDLESYVRRIDA
jgi:CRP-like cAMP-binding protein